MISPKEKRCHICLELRPITEFRRYHRDKDARNTECRECHNRRERERRAERQAKDKRSELTKFTSRIARTYDYRKIAATYGDLIERFGGLNGFANEIRRQFDLAPAGSSLQLNTLNTIMRVGEFVEANRPAQPDELDLLTDEDLERLQHEQLKRLIDAEPELLVAAATRLGFKVVSVDPEAEVRRTLGNVP